MGKKLGSGWEIVVWDSAPEGFLNALSEQEVDYYAPQPLDAVSIYFQIPYGAVGQVRRIAEGRGSDLRICRPFGWKPRMLQLTGRTAFLAALIICAVILAVSNLFVWRIDVTGNETIPADEIRRAVTRAGGGIGSFWPAFNSEQMRTRLLLQLEDVQWAGINYRTGAIEVVVRERRGVPEIVDNEEPIHIIAEKAGVITDIAAKQGQTRVGTGDTVEKGQVLISGAAVSSIGTTRGVHALGTVQARTWYALTARQTGTEVGKTYSGQNKKKISLILGTNRVNFYSDSSIFEDSCDTIIMDYHLCADGVFTLPVRIIVQQCVYWSALERKAEAQVQENRAQSALMEVLKRKIGEGGSVLSAEFAAVPRTNGMTVTLMAECMEEIGKEVPISEEELRQIQLDNTLREEETTND